MHKGKTYCLHISAKYALYTRPEHKGERISYDIPTPSVVRGVFESICGKPAYRWCPKTIEVIKRGKWKNIARNEINKKPASDFLVDDNEVRMQRNSLLLSDVEYYFHATFELTKQAGDGDSIVKFSAMFERRMEKGQFFRMPYLGCREFVATVAAASGEKKPLIDDSENFGVMFFDWDPGYHPTVFNPVMKNGVINIPHHSSGDEVFRMAAKEK